MVTLIAIACGYYIYLDSWEPLRMNVVVYDRDNEDLGDRLLIREARRTYIHPSLLSEKELDGGKMTQKSYLNGECFVLTVQKNKVNFADTYEDRITYFGPSPYYRELPIEEIRERGPMNLSHGYRFFSPKLPSETILFVFRLAHNNKVYTLLSLPEDHPDVATLEGSKYLTVIIDINKDNVVELQKSQYEKAIRNLLGNFL